MSVVKIGVYGGTFNPPHLGHLAAARAAVGELGLDKLILVPDAMPPHKELPKNTPAPEHRLAMTEKLADALLMPERVQVSRLERKAIEQLRRRLSEECGRKKKNRTF